MAVDYAELGAQIRAADAGGADGFHLDIMDGHFVPNLTFGADLIRSIRGLTAKEFDAHLMVTNPLQYLDALHEAGVNSVTIHVEIDHDVVSLLKSIAAKGLKTGLALKPATPLDAIPVEAWPVLDRILIMTVEPGYGGQAFIDQSVKIQHLQQSINEENHPIDIQVDGGINQKTASLVIDAGAQTLVAGSAVFKADRPITEATQALRPLS